VFPWTPSWSWEVTYAGVSGRSANPTVVVSPNPSDLITLTMLWNGSVCLEKSML